MVKRSWANLKFLLGFRRNKKMNKYKCKRYDDICGRRWCNHNTGLTLSWLALPVATQLEKRCDRVSTGAFICAIACAIGPHWECFACIGSNIGSGEKIFCLPKNDPMATRWLTITFVLPSGPIVLTSCSLRVFFVLPSVARALFLYIFEKRPLNILISSFKLKM